MSVSLTFRCPDDLAELIQHQVETTGKDKTSVIISMLRQSLSVTPLEENRNTLSNDTSNAESDKDNLDALIEERMTTVFDKRLTILLDERITARVDSLVDERGLKPEIIALQLEEHTSELATELNATISELREQLEELRGKSIAR